MSWIELARTSFTPGPSPVPDFFCSPWTNFGPPDKPQYYVASGQPYTFDVPAGKQATHLQVWAISYRHKNWITDIAWAEFDGQPHNMTDWVTSDSGTCANLHFEQKLDGSAKHSIKLLDAAGDAQFLISHARIQVVDMASSSTSTSTSTSSSTFASSSSSSTVSSSSSASISSPTSLSSSASTSSSTLSSSSSGAPTLIDNGGTTSVISTIEHANPTNSDSAPSTDSTDAPSAPEGAAGRKSVSAAVFALVGLALFGTLA
ncbi:hypothetical protein EXIGLDRAFT_777460 [Exidia glandulosa HHB12029]|uniref:Uncharacterized protein n=1 Tax=Exidia glandulosa HHB12029 TaxID=1314781 RepID=A0A165D039_EXIGL|nr:hypothetical protein EXIGLDRAFT_777460 [Exidia glandulosa HHB12029]